MIDIKKTENEKHLEIYLEMIGKKKGDKLELYQVLDIMNIAQDLVKKLTIPDVVKPFCDCGVKINKIYAVQNGKKLCLSCAGY